MSKFFKKKKLKHLSRIGVVVLFFLLQLSFLLAILAEGLDTPLKIVLVLVVSLLLSMVFLKIIKEKPEHRVGHPILVLFVVLGAAFTYYLSTEMDLGPVISAAGIGLAVSYLPSFNKSSELLKQIPAAVYCGTFVGMCSSEIVSNFMFIIFAGLLSGLIYIFSTGAFQGFGGKLGTIAFGGVCLASLILFLIL